jgi:DNA-binding response OmpR family regulator
VGVVEEDRVQQTESVAPPGVPQLLRVLMVEDDVAVARALALALRDEGLDVRVATTGGEAREHLRSDQLDAVLLDLGLPDEEGLALCAAVREHTDVPIIVVSARSGSSDVVKGLEAGADDYVSKPVVGSELAARVRALVRRTSPADQEEWVRCGDLAVSTRYGTVRRAGEDLPMTRTERSLIKELALRCGTPVSREELLERVWGYDYFGDTRLLDVHVRRLRLKIEPHPSAPRHLVTVRGLGYRLDP